MGRKNRNKKNKKKKESDGSTGNVNGGNNNNNNNHNNNNSIPTVDVDDETVVATTTMVLTPNQIDEIDRKYQLAGYPKSNYFVDGYRARKANKDDLAADAFKRGATEVSCVPSTVGYAELQRERGNVHLSVPFYIEAAIQGHTGSMGRLTGLYEQSKPKIARALVSVWTKMKIELGDTEHTEENRKEHKKIIANMCFICGKGESEGNNVTLVKCGICKHYSYCGKKCQTRHWKEGKHMHECRQVILLRKYCKPQYVKEIREAIIGGQDPKDIHTLQRLRMKLGLNRPKEEYEELLLSLANDDNNNNNSNNKNTMKRGMKVQVKGLVNAPQHNGKIGIVTKASIPGEVSGSSRVGVKLVLDDSSTTVLHIKIDNLEPAPTTSTNPRHSNSNSNHPNPFEYLVARKDGTVHIGSTPSVMNIQVPDSVQQDGESGLTEAGLRSINIAENVHPIGDREACLRRKKGKEKHLTMSDDNNVTKHASSHRKAELETLLRKPIFKKSNSNFTDDQIKVAKGKKKAPDINPNNGLKSFLPSAYWRELKPNKERVVEPPNPSFDKARAPTVAE